MSTQERTDDPGEHGYGAAKQDANVDEAEQDEDVDDGRGDVVPSDLKRDTGADGDWPS